MSIAAVASCWPIAGEFRTARGSKTAASVITAWISRGERVGRGECVPYPRFDESIEGVLETLRELEDPSRFGWSRAELNGVLPAGAARNAIDCALWDLEAKRRNVRAWELAKVPEAQPLETAYTLSVGEPDTIYAIAQKNRNRPLLKLKVDGHNDLACVEALHAGAPHAKIIIDANESWDEPLYRRLAPKLATFGVVALEQPFPDGEDDALKTLPHPIPVCADESCHERADLDRVGDRYDMINIKLNKTGGLTEALALARAAKKSGLKIMVGCHVCTSLGIAPSWIVGQYAELVDLDGHLLLETDRPNPVALENGKLTAPPAELWG